MRMRNENENEEVEEATRDKDVGTRPTYRKPRTKDKKVNRHRRMSLEERDINARQKAFKRTDMKAMWDLVIMKDQFPINDDFKVQKLAEIEQAIKQGFLPILEGMKKENEGLQTVPYHCSTPPFVHYTSARKAFQARGASDNQSAHRRHFL